MRTGVKVALDPMAQASSRFDIVRRGYDRDQVDERLRDLEAELEQERRARQDSEQRNAELNEQLRNVRAELSWPSRESMPEVTDRVGQILQLAEEEAADIRSTANTELDEARTRGETELEAARESARSQRAAAAQEVDQLQAVRDDLRRRLLSARDVLDGMPRFDRADDGPDGADADPSARMDS